MALHKPGDWVRVDSPRYPGIWEVIKVNPARYKLRQDGRLLSCPHEMALGAGETPASRSAPTLAMPAGSIVRASRPPKGYKGGSGNIFFVLRDNGETVSMTVPGGDGGRYWTGYPKSRLEIVPPSALLEGTCAG